MDTLTTSEAYGSPPPLLSLDARVRGHDDSERMLSTVIPASEAGKGTLGLRRPGALPR